MEPELQNFKGKKRDTEAPDKIHLQARASDVFCKLRHGSRCRLYGNLRYASSRDHHQLIHGFDVKVGDITSVLNSHPQTSSAATASCAEGKKERALPCPFSIEACLTRGHQIRPRLPSPRCRTPSHRRWHAGRRSPWR